MTTVVSMVKFDAYYVDMYYPLVYLKAMRIHSFSVSVGVELLEGESCNECYYLLSKAIGDYLESIEKYNGVPTLCNEKLDIVTEDLYQFISLRIGRISERYVKVMLFMDNGLGVSKEYNSEIDRLSKLYDGEK